MKMIITEKASAKLTGSIPSIINAASPTPVKVRAAHMAGKEKENPEPTQARHQTTRAAHISGSGRKCVLKWENATLATQ